MTKETLYYDKSQDYFIGSVGQSALVKVIVDFEDGRTTETLTQPIVQKDNEQFETSRYLFKPLKLGRIYD